MTSVGDVDLVGGTILMSNGRYTWEITLTFRLQAPLFFGPKRKAHFGSRQEALADMDVARKEMLGLIVRETGPGVTILDAKNGGFVDPEAYATTTLH